MLTIFYPWLIYQYTVLFNLICTYIENVLKREEGIGGIQIYGTSKWMT